MRLREYLVPQEKVFFKLLADQSFHLVKGAEMLYDMLANNDVDLRQKVLEIKEIENEGDAATHELYVRLNRTFVTPIDREDLMDLASKCDDALDAINGVARRIFIYEIGKPQDNMRNFAELILKSSRALSRLMTNIKNADQSKVDKECEEVDMLENQGDELLHAALVELFRRDDMRTVEIIKFKEIYEWLESTLDRCENAAYAVADIVMKNR